MTVVGSVPQSPESITASTAWPSWSSICHPCGQGLVLVRQQQRARDERLAEFGEQRPGHRVPGDPHPDGLLSRVLQPARYLPGRGQDEGVTARRCRLDGPEHPVGDARELAELGEVLAHQREVVPVIEMADRPDPGDAVGVAELAAERVAGVRRVGDHAASADDIGDLRRSCAVAGWPDGCRSTWPCDELRGRHGPRGRCAVRSRRCRAAALKASRSR